MISVCICDDSNISIAHLKMQLSRFQEENDISFQIKALNTGEELLSDLASGISYQIYLLDVLLPGETGIELAREIRRTDQSAGIVFLSASKDFALEAFSVSATDYLLKPVSYESLAHALLRILFPQKSILETAKLNISSNGTIQSIPIDSICYVEVQKNKLIYTLSNGKLLEEYKTLASLQEDLGQHPEFVKIHRSYLINMSFLQEITPNEVTLAPNHHLPVSRSYASSLKESYLAYTK